MLRCGPLPAGSLRLWLPAWMLQLLTWMLPDRLRCSRCAICRCPGGIPLHSSNAASLLRDRAADQPAAWTCSITAVCNRSNTGCTAGMLAATL